MRTSILARLTAPICEALCRVAPPPAEPAGAGDALEILEHLERGNLFVVPLDEEHTAFRYHRLFADLLRRQLALAHPELVRPLHECASAWLAGHGFPERAVQHALLAGDHERAAELLAQGAPGLWSRGEHATLLRLLRSLPEAHRRADPRLAIYEAGAYVSAGQFDAAARRLDALEGRLATNALDDGNSRLLRGRAAALRAQMAASLGDADAALEHAQAARALLTPQETAWMGSFGVAVGNVLMMAARY